MTEMTTLEDKHIEVNAAFYAMENKSKYLGKTLVNQTIVNPTIVFGNPVLPAGGRALRHFKALSMRISRIIQKNYQDGFCVNLGKNKLGLPRRSCEFYLPES